MSVGRNERADDPRAKADALRLYGLPDILQLRFNSLDMRHHGTIQSWVMEKEAPQLRGYIKSAEVQQQLEKQSLQLKAHFVIIVGSRHILLWDMDEEGNLAPEPRLATIPDRSKRQDGLGCYY